jgi:hypothetical protein
MAYTTPLEILGLQRGYRGYNTYYEHKCWLYTTPSISSPLHIVMNQHKSSQTALMSYTY